MKLKLEAVSKSFGGQIALNAVSLSLQDVHSLVFIGPSGGGKSTLLRIIGGLETPDSGSVEVNGQRLSPSKRNCAAIAGESGRSSKPSTFFRISPPWPISRCRSKRCIGASPEKAVELARMHLARFGLEAHAHKKPAELSGGQRQRVAIARALSIEPRFMLFDEPTSALDPEMTAEVLAAIEELRAEGRDLIVVTHQMAFARRIADRGGFPGRWPHR